MAYILMPLADLIFHFCCMKDADYFFFLFQKVYLWLCWVFVAARALSPAAESGGYSLAVVHGPRAHGFQQSRSLGSVAVAPGL